MRILIAEDDFLSRMILRDILAPYGSCDLAVDGGEAVLAFTLAWEDHRPYSVIFMDIMMPGLNGLEAVRQIRGHERENGIDPDAEVKIVMITSLGDPKTVFDAFYRSGANAYVVKPISVDKITGELVNQGLIGAPESENRLSSGREHEGSR